MNYPVKIIVRTVGDNFAEEAIVRDGDRLLYRTREVPYGFGSRAYEMARRWAESVGYGVEEDGA